MLLFYLSPPPTKIILFPYTTLFRSPPGSWLVRVLRPARQPRDCRRHLRRAQRTRLSWCADRQARHRDLFRQAGDRKSTRLNSSHLVISYAVFYLKKKKEYKN